MKHFGDITKISGYEVPIVDVITGGSPCQDLSVAGKRAGLSGERSGLFMEQIRIIKEMRDRDVRESGRSAHMGRVRYFIWENVPGALSSGAYTDEDGKVWKGEDFRIVLEEFARVKEPDAVIPRLEKWQNSGCIMGNGWSLAWKIVDAQFWGTPQRRRRIALLCDFDGYTAPEILFDAQLRRETESAESDKAFGYSGRVIGESEPLPSVSQSLPRDSEPCSQKGQGTAERTEVGINGSVAGTLDSNYYKGCGERQGIEREVVSYAVDCRNGVEDQEINAALQSRACGNINSNNVVRQEWTNEPL